MIKKFFTGALLCLFSSTFAQVHEIDSITVTASRFKQNIEHSGRSITVITSDEIKSLPVSSVDELLRYVAGVNLNMRGAFGVQTDIGMRGSTFSQVLIVLDNVRLNDPLTGHFNNNIPVPLTEIEKIEIIRGPSASAFGVDAVGGMIHIKTKTFMATSAPEGVKMTGNIGIGQHNLITSDMGVFGGKGPVVYSAAFRQNIADGEVLADPNFPDSLGQTYNNYFDIRTFSASIGYIPDNSFRITARAGYDLRDFKAKYFYTGSSFDNAYETVSTSWMQSNVQYRNGKHTTDLSLGFKRTQDSYMFNPLFTPMNEHTIVKTFSNFNHQYNINSHSTLILGVQLEERGINSNERGDHVNRSLGYYGLYRLDWKNLNLTAGLRLEDDDNFGQELVPQINIAYSTGKFIFRTSTGKAVRAADFTERFISSQLDSSSLFAMRNIGNANLLAERSITHELGMLYRNEGWSIDLSIFQRRSSNLIDYVVTNSDSIEGLPNLRASTNYLYAQNISSSATQGIELQLQKKFEFGKVSLFPQLAYTFLQTTTEDSVVSKYIANHPVHQMNIGLTVSAGAFGLQVNCSQIRRNADAFEAIAGAIPDAYGIGNLKLSYKVHEDKFGVYLQINNIRDQKYQEILGAQMPGRWTIVGMQWNL